jgi:hypothetical protein
MFGSFPCENNQRSSTRMSDDFFEPPAHFKEPSESQSEKKAPTALKSLDAELKSSLSSGTRRLWRNRAVRNCRGLPARNVPAIDAAATQGI